MFKVLSHETSVSVGTDGKTITMATKSKSLNLNAKLEIIHVSSWQLIKM
jgi:hypothetical protein